MSSRGQTGTRTGKTRAQKSIQKAAATHRANVVASNRAIIKQIQDDLQRSALDKASAARGAEEAARKTPAKTQAGYAAKEQMLAQSSTGRLAELHSQLAMLHQRASTAESYLEHTTARPGHRNTNAAARTQVRSQLTDLKAQIKALKASIKDEIAAEKAARTTTRTGGRGGAKEKSLSGMSVLELNRAASAAYQRFDDVAQKRYTDEMVRRMAGGGQILPFGSPESKASLRKAVGK